MKTQGALVPGHSLDFLSPDGKRFILRLVMDALTRAVVSAEIHEAPLPLSHQRTRGDR